MGICTMAKKHSNSEIQLGWSLFCKEHNNHEIWKHLISFFACVKTSPLCYPINPINDNLAKVLFVNFMPQPHDHQFFYQTLFKAPCFDNGVLFIIITKRHIRLHFFVVVSLVTSLHLNGFGFFFHVQFFEFIFFG